MAITLNLPEIKLKKPVLENLDSQEAKTSAAPAQASSSSGSGSAPPAGSSTNPMDNSTPIFMSNINLFDDDEQKEGGDKWSARETVFCLRDQKALYGDSTLSDCYRYEGQTI